MSLSNNTWWDVHAGGNDANGGGFDPGNANMLTDGAATVANGNSPVFSSASYNFVAGDVGAWVYIKSGTNWTAGWYQIASVASNVATLSAAIGSAFCIALFGPNSVAGCATIASPTGATWAVDYSQQDAAAISFTDLVVDPTTNTKATSVAHPIQKAWVGNILNITSGTGFTVQRVQLSSVAANVGTFDKSFGTLSSVGGNGAMGGAFATYGLVGSLWVSKNGLWIKGITTYTTTSVSTNVSGGTINNTAADGSFIRGYGTVRGDGGRPTIKLGVNSSIFYTANFPATLIQDLIIDGDKANRTGTAGVNGGQSVMLYNVTLTNHASTSINAGASDLVKCYLLNSGGTNTIKSIRDSYITGTSGVGLTCNSGGAGWCINNIIYNNSSHGISLGGHTSSIYGNTIIGNGGDGITFGGNNGLEIIENNIVYGNTGVGIRISQTSQSMWIDRNFLGANIGGDFLASGTATIAGASRTITLTGNPCVNPAGGDFSLNTTAGAGAAVRDSTTFQFLGSNTTTYRDGGAQVPPRPTLPGVGDVRSGTTFGMSGGSTGTLALPSINDVRLAISFGTNGTQYTGNLILPSIANVFNGITFGTSGTQYTGTLSIPTAAQITTSILTNLTSSSDFNTSGSIGKLLKDNIDSKLSDIKIKTDTISTDPATATNQTTINNNILSIKVKTDNIPANPVDISDIPKMRIEVG